MLFRGAPSAAGCRAALRPRLELGGGLPLVVLTPSKCSPLVVLTPISAHP